MLLMGKRLREGPQVGKSADVLSLLRAKVSMAEVAQYVWELCQEYF